MTIDANDAANISAAIQAGGNIWKSPLVDDFKQKAKTYYRDLLEEQCCYCRKNTLGEFKMVLDIEHILPKSKFPQYMFATFNLSISCKRCNMNIKKEDVSFVTDLTQIDTTPQQSGLYKIVHPNVDDYFEHISYYTQTIDDKKIVKYRIINESSKGQFTYDYFKLNELEVDSINQAQGLQNDETVSDLIDPVIAKQIEDLLRASKKK